jgi:RNA polymerase sigma factor (TIGR02999 family)
MAGTEGLFEALYPELRAIAGRIFRSQSPGHTMQPTVLLHEAYLKIAGSAGAPDRWKDKAHFCNVAAKAMRQILVNHARDKSALKRGGPDAHRVTLIESDAVQEFGALDVLALDEALDVLHKLDARHARIAELRLFAGLSAEEVAEALDLSKRTVELDWRLTKAWLSERLDTRS